MTSMYATLKILYNCYGQQREAIPTGRHSHACHISECRMFMKFEANDDVMELMSVYITGTYIQWINYNDFMAIQIFV